MKEEKEEIGWNWKRNKGELFLQVHEKKREFRAHNSNMGGGVGMLLIKG